MIYSNWSHLLSHNEKGEAWGGNSQQHCREKRLGWEERVRVKIVERDWERVNENR